MTALVLDNLATLPLQAQSLRLLLARWARALDALVSARAARQVPEWQIRQVRSEVNRYQTLIREAAVGQGRKPGRGASKNI